MNDDNAKRSNFSLGLRFQAGKGKFTTRAPRANLVPTPAAQPPIVAAIATESFDGAASSHSHIRNARASLDTEIQYKTPRPEDAAIIVEKDDQETLSPDRAMQEVAVTDVAQKRELLITGAAAKSLTRVYAALALEPGSGNEIPAHIRTQVLDTLIRESHILADKICKNIVSDGKQVPTYLRAKLLQQAVEFISEQWADSGKIDTSILEELASKAFRGEVDAITQEVVDLFHVAGEYTPANDEEISRSRITESVIRATWGFLKQINHFDLRDYDPNVDKDSEPQPFKYGKEASAIALDLTNIALRITKENELVISNLDIRTTWTQNSIDRASSLVKVEYRMLTDRALRSCFKEDLFSEAAISHVNGLYGQIMEKIYSRARNGFILVEKSAIDAMSANSYTHYLPKKNAATQKTPMNQINSGTAEESGGALRVGESQTLGEKSTEPPAGRKLFSFQGRQRNG